jgi:glutathione S-transferase
MPTQQLTHPALADSDASNRFSGVAALKEPAASRSSSEVQSQETRTITVVGHVPAWGLPDISPYVTKLVNYLHMVGLEHEIKPQDMGGLDDGSPNGKLPYMIDDDGTKVADSTRIIAYLKSKHGDVLDGDMSKSEQAAALAWNRLVEELLLWSGAIQPRWRENSGWETYVPAEVLVAFKEDIDALSDFLADKPFFLGDNPRALDASVYASVRHIIDVPFEWAGRDHARSKANLIAYAGRMRERFGI